MSAKFCSSCGAALSPGAVFCAACGTSVQAPPDAGAATPPPTGGEPSPAPPPPTPRPSTAAPPPVAPGPPPQPVLPPQPGTPSQVSAAKPILIGVGALLALVAAFVLLGSDIFGGSRSRSTASNLESFIIGSWGRGSDCSRTLTFESGGRLLATGEDPGTWTLRTEGAGMHILRVEIDGTREQGWVEQRGEQLDIFQSQGNNLSGRYSRCGGATATAGSGAPASPSTMPPAAPAVPADRQNSWAYLIGRWGRNGDCSRVITLNADGTMQTNNGDNGTWSASGAFGTYPLTMTAGGRTVRATAISRSANDMQLVPNDGSAALQLTRCGGTTM